MNSLHDERPEGWTAMQRGGVLIRRLQPDDVEPLVLIETCPKVRKFLGPLRSTPDELRARYHQIAELGAWDDRGLLAVANAQTDFIVGRCAIVAGSETDPEGSDPAEHPDRWPLFFDLTIVLGQQKSSIGTNVGTVVADMLCDYAFKRGAQWIGAESDKLNDGARRVMTTLGFRECESQAHGLAQEYATVTKWPNGPTFYRLDRPA